MTPQNQQDQNPIQQVGGKETVRDQDKIMLILSYLGLLSLIPLLTVKDSDYVVFHARQGIVLFAFAILLQILNVVPVIGWIVGCLGSVAVLVLMVMGIVKALGGERWRMPLISDIVSKVF